MRHSNDIQITTNWFESRRSVSQQRGANRRGEEHTSPIYYLPCTIKVECDHWAGPKVIRITKLQHKPVFLCINLLQMEPSKVITLSGLNCI